MLNPFPIVRALKKEGKLHSKLVLRLRVLLGISLILAIIVIINIFRHEVNPLLTIFIGILGYLLGKYFFSGMNKVVWNEEEEIVKAGRMDMIGFISILFYVAFEIVFRSVLHDIYADSSVATSYILIGISGTLLGRCLGMMYAMIKATYAK